MTRLAILTGALALAMTASTQAASPVSTPSGLRYTDEVVGTGPQPKTGQSVQVHYTGWLDQAGAKGAKFDSSKDRNDPFEFALGAGMVIQGWDQGLVGMKVGGRRELVIPPSLGYGSQANQAIPADSTLVFVVDLVSVKAS